MARRLQLAQATFRIGEYDTHGIFAERGYGQNGGLRAKFNLKDTAQAEGNLGCRSVFAQQISSSVPGQMKSLGFVCIWEWRAGWIEKLKFMDGNHETVRICS